MRVCIIATSWDKEIVVKSIYKASADKVYLIIPLLEEETKDVSTKTLLVAEKIKSELASLADIETLQASYLDYFKAFKVISDLVKQEVRKRNEIIINISSGNKIVSTALLTTAFLYGLKAYYSLPNEYNPDFFYLDKPWRQGVKKIVEIPTLPLHINFSKKEKAFLSWLASSSEVEVRDYITAFEHANENKARASFHYYVDKFKSLGLIGVRISHGKKIISLTETGRIISAVID